MVRISKQSERRAQSPRKNKKPSPKTGAKKDNLPKGHIHHANALEGELASSVYISKIE